MQKARKIMIGWAMVGCLLSGIPSQTFGGNFWDFQRSSISQATVTEEVSQENLRYYISKIKLPERKTCTIVAASVAACALLGYAIVESDLILESLEKGGNFLYSAGCEAGQFLEEKASEVFSVITGSGPLECPADNLWGDVVEKTVSSDVCEASWDSFLQHSVEKESVYTALTTNISSWMGGGVDFLTQTSHSLKQSVSDWAEGVTQSVKTASQTIFEYIDSGVRAGFEKICPTPVCPVPQVPVCVCPQPLVADPVFPVDIYRGGKEGIHVIKDRLPLKNIWILDCVGRNRTL